MGTWDGVEPPLGPLLLSTCCSPSPEHTLNLTLDIVSVSAKIQLSVTLMRTLKCYQEGWCCPTETPLTSQPPHQPSCSPNGPPGSWPYLGFIWSLGPT